MARMEISTAEPIVKSGIFSEREAVRAHAERGGNRVGDQRGDHTWHEGGIVHDADTHHLHGEDGGCHRSAEQRGKRSAHTAHDHDVLVLLIKMKQTSQTVSNTAAELRGSTLTAGRTAGTGG